MRKHIEKLESYRMSENTESESRLENSVTEMCNNMPDAFASITTVNHC